MPPSSSPASPPPAAALLERAVAEIEPLHRDLNAAQWDASVTGDAADTERRATLDRRLRAVLARPEALAEVRAARASTRADFVVDRQLDVLERMRAAHQMPADTLDHLVRLETELDRMFNTYRAELGGRPVTDNALRDVLQHSNDTDERRAAWEASKQIGAAVEPPLLELVRRRNAAARDLGHANYFTMMLELDELDEAELFGLLDAVERGTRPAFERYRRALDARLAERFGVTPDRVRPWHLGDPFFQEAPAPRVDLDRPFAGRELPALARATFDAIGIDTERLLARASLYEQPGKSQHAFCLSVDRGDDVRVLCNLVPNEFWMGVLLHELGHAVYDDAIDRALPWLLRTPAHTLVTEASAMLFGRWSRLPAWLERHAGLSTAETRAWTPELDRHGREQLLVMTRWCLVMSHMERELYRDPEQDLASRWWELVEGFQLVPRPDGRRAPDWASKIHFSVAPVYYHNYLLGEVLASQLQDALLRRTGATGRAAWDRALDDPATGRLLVDRLYRPGRSRDWRATITHAVGRPLAPDAFVAELSATS